MDINLRTKYDLPHMNFRVCFINFGITDVVGVMDLMKSLRIVGILHIKISPDSLDWLLLHQANKRILDAVADRFSIPHEKVLSNLANYGNTSAATIPLMLDEAVRDGRVQPNQLIASSGFGAGLSWGVALFKWDGPS